VVPLTAPFVRRKLPTPNPVLVISATSPVGVGPPAGTEATVTLRFAVAPCVIVRGDGVIPSVVALPLEPVTAVAQALTRFDAFTVPKPVARS
jgi:hypothetical protein